MPPLRHSDLVNTLVVGVNDTVVAGLLGVPAGLCAALRVRLLIQLLGNLVERLLDFFGGLLDGLDVGALVDFLQVVNSGLLKYNKGVYNFQQASGRRVTSTFQNYTSFNSTFSVQFSLRYRFN